MNTRPLFELGDLYITPGALAVLKSHGKDSVEFLRRHAHGDWKHMNLDDWIENEVAIEYGDRIFSSFPVGEDTKIWVITEADRSSTTVLLPHEY